MSTYARRIALTVTTVFGLTLSTAGQGIERTYSAEAITGWVVDAQTAQPIEGVNIVAGWRLEGGLENNYRAWFQVYETVTDLAGKYIIPAWGPQTKAVSGALRDGAPVMFFFKRGYEFHYVSNADAGLASAHTTSDWNGKPIPLKRSGLTLQQYATASSIAINPVLDELLRNRDECNWLHIPKFIYAVEEQNKAFRAAGVTYFTRSLDYLNETYRGSCGDLRRFVEEKGP